MEQNEKKEHTRSPSTSIGYTEDQELTVSIPSTYGPKFDIDEGASEYYDINLREIDTLIKDMTNSLKICDQKSFNALDHSHSKHSDSWSDSTAKPTHSIHISSLTCEKNGNDTSFALQAPDIWWDNGIGYIFGWLKEIFLRDMAMGADTLLSKQSNILFFQWPSYESKVTMEAMSCSLAIMLEPWTSRYSEHDKEKQQLKIYPPKNIKNQKKTVQKECHVLENALKQLMQDIQSSASRYSAANPSFSEILQGLVRTMRTLDAIQEKEYEHLMNYRRDSRYNGMVAAKTVMIIQEWIYDQAMQKIKNRVSHYQHYNDELTKSFVEPMNRLRTQKHKFKTLCAEIKEKYNQFLKAQNAAATDEAAMNAIEIMCHVDNDDDEFGIETVKLLKNYVNLMKRISYYHALKGTELEDIDQPNDVHAQEIDKCFYPLRHNHEEGDHKGSDQKNANHPLRKIYNHYELQQMQLKDINKKIAEKKRSSDFVDKSHIDEIEALEKERQKTVDAATSSIEILKKYDDYPMDIHNQWLSALDKIEQHLKDVAAAWSKIYGQKYKREAELEEEIGASLLRIKNNTYQSFHNDIDETVKLWHNKQHQLEKKKEESLRQVMMERYVANEWLSTFERKMIYHVPNNTNIDYNRKITEFKALLSMLNGCRETLYKLNDFEEAYYDLVDLWNMVYHYSRDNTREFL